MLRHFGGMGLTDRIEGAYETQPSQKKSKLELKKSKLEVVNISSCFNTTAAIYCCCLDCVATSHSPPRVVQISSCFNTSYFSQNIYKIIKINQIVKSIENYVEACAEVLDE